MANNCALCGKTVDVSRGLSIKAICSHCSGDLHICLNCRFYSPSSHNSCTETRSEMQRSRDKANFCDWFQFSGGAAGSSDAASKLKDDVKKKFDDLFRK